MVPAWDELILVGRTARTHGNRGHLIINPETDFPEDRFQTGRVVYAHLRGQVESLRITAVRFQHGRPIVGFDGIRTIDDAEQLANLELRVPADTLQPLPHGMFYRHDLIGCRVVTTAGAFVGRIAAVEGSLEASRLVIDSEKGEILVPLAADICVRVDPGAGEVIISPPEGLLELNS